MKSDFETRTAPAAESGLFKPTHWSVVLRAKEKSEIALETLCQTYRQPLIVWLRIRGYTSHDAEDLVQGFLANLLRRDFLENVAREKGAFRTFLLKCLKNFLRDDHDRKLAAKRGRGISVDSLDETADDGHKLHDPAARDAGPDLEYDRAWARTVLDSAVRDLEEECTRQGHSALCAAIQPVMFSDETASPYCEIGARLGMSEGAVKVAAYRMRLRLRELIRDQVLQTVADEQDWPAEMRYLIELFGKQEAGT